MNKMYKLWNKTTCYEIYFRPVDEFEVKVITYLNGDPFVNPRSKIKDGDDANTEVWPVEDARESWDAWVNHGGYEVSEVEDYLMAGSMNLQKREFNELTKERSNVTMNGKLCSVSDISKALKGHPYPRHRMPQE